MRDSDFSILDFMRWVFEPIRASRAGFSGYLVAGRWHRYREYYDLSYALFELVTPAGSTVSIVVFALACLYCSPLFHVQLGAQVMLP